MKTLYNKLHIFGQTMLLVFFTLSVLSLGSCSKETLDYNHPDVDLFVKQLKAGKYSTQSPDGLSNMPKFTSEDIEELLKYAEDLTVIPSFPLAPVSYVLSETALHLHLLPGQNILEITSPDSTPSYLRHTYRYNIHLHRSKW